MTFDLEGAKRERGRHVTYICVMGFLQSYLRLPRYQRVLLGLAGIAVGWYGPDLMSQLFFVKDRSKKQEIGVPSSSADHVIQSDTNVKKLRSSSSVRS